MSVEIKYKTTFLCVLFVCKKRFDDTHHYTVIDINEVMESYLACQPATNVHKYLFIFRLDLIIQFKSQC